MPDSGTIETIDEHLDKEVLARKLRTFLKVELKRREMGYADLSRRLTEMGIPETEKSITMKISRGVYPAWFLVAVMRAIGLPQVRVDDLV